jgi:hypothetical protein
VTPFFALFTHIFKALSTPDRIRIIVLCSDNELTITEISKSRDRPFSRTSDYVSSPEKLGPVEKTKHGDKTVTVRSLVEINQKGELKFRE